MSAEDLLFRLMLLLSQCIIACSTARSLSDSLEFSCGSMKSTEDWVLLIVAAPSFLGFSLGDGSGLPPPDDAMFDGRTRERMVRSSPSVEMPSLPASSLPVSSFRSLPLLPTIMSSPPTQSLRSLSSNERCFEGPYQSHAALPNPRSIDAGSGAGASMECLLAGPPRPPRDALLP